MKNSLGMHDVIDRRARAFVQGVAHSQTGVQGGRFSRAMQNVEFFHYEVVAGGD